MITLIRVSRFTNVSDDGLIDFELERLRKLISDVKSFLFDVHLDSMVEDICHCHFVEIDSGVSSTTLQFDVEVYGEPSMLDNDYILKSGSVFKELAEFLANRFQTGDRYGSIDQLKLNCTYYEDKTFDDFVTRGFFEEFVWDDSFNRI